ncbi:MAG: DUF4870 domain-containing protein [Dysgonamonadaceae bacterium]|jgi:uncharacterized Tic20 family protein|nr:DUF4870 domain-containing protein [Dysgonamonadaceae bacterium]
MNYEDLKILDELRKNGSITEEEYQREKQKVFDSTERSSRRSKQELLGLGENSYLALMHLSQLAGYLIFGVGFIAPLILWLINKDNNERVNVQGKEIINFIISMVLYALISTVLCIILIGFVMLVALAVIQIVCAVMAAIKANNGEDYVYPLTIRFLK